MFRDTKRATLIVCVLAMAACSGTPQTMLSPSAVAPTTMFANLDGSTLKATAPRDLGPTGGVTVNTLRPTLSFTNATGLFVSSGFAYDLEVQNANGTVVYSRVIGETATSGSHQLEADLTYADNFWWRTRARLGTQVGPWSDFAQFRTLDPPPPPPSGPPAPGPGTGGLPFPIPGACLAGDGGGCAFAIAGLSDEWARCRGGNGVGCHRFSRQVVFALSRNDPNWMMIQAAPGGHACNCFVCGPSDGTMFREDTTVYGGSQVFDMIVGAGGPNPSVGWSFVGAPRPGDGPNVAPVCQ